MVHITSVKQILQLLKWRYIDVIKTSEIEVETEIEDLSWKCQILTVSQASLFVATTVRIGYRRWYSCQPLTSWTTADHFHPKLTAFIQIWLFTLLCRRMGHSVSSLFPCTQSRARLLHNNSRRYKQKAIFSIAVWVQWRRLHHKSLSIALAAQEQQSLHCKGGSAGKSGILKCWCKDFGFNGRIWGEHLWWYHEEGQTLMSSCRLSAHICLRRPQFCKQPIMNNRCWAFMRHHTLPHLLAWSSVLGAVNWICSEQSWVILDKIWGMIFCFFLYNRVDWNYCSNNFMVDRNPNCCPHLTTFWAFCAS